MKNLFVLRSKTPSKLGYIYESDSYHIFTNGENPHDICDNLAVYRHIYITSDEDLKYGDWYINTLLENGQLLPQTHTKKSDFVAHKKDPLFKYCKKIALTTEIDLGIRAVPDTFLKWLTKNPLCEQVEVTFEKMFPLYKSFTEDVNIPPFYGNLIPKIAIPADRCCGRCDGVNDICFADMECEPHKILGCEECYGKKTVDIELPEKEIVGYRLKPHIERNTVNAVLKNSMPIWNAEDKSVYFIRGHVGGCLVAKLKDLQLLDIWFTPIYNDEEVLSDWMQQHHYEYYLKEGHMSLTKDDEMIDFVEWVLINYPNQHSYMKLIQKIRRGIRVPEYGIKGFYTTEQLLEQFKKIRL